ncbi:MAG: bifunctional 2-polyprenyl-6-hydroxyphenol methylase/3-demethylubiquinol 3-O-methyltransferase UbiG [Candidatus Methylopumilus sp.]|nr:bifunctional 2-polyprenyl-6-hydroxyphenol methylase/3-demethylubiquinol 3-O-methyltransferase UbiG [Candidatus Methylopumilus sp.]
MAIKTKTKHINVYHEEVDKFNELAHKWWDETSEFKPLHDINPLRLDFIHEKVNLKNKKVLDVGCGGGILSESMASLGAKVTGIDMGDKVIRIAELHALQSKLNIDYQCTSLEEVALKHESIFDVITCMEMLEHVPEPKKIVSLCAKLLKPGGTLFFSTINRNLKAYVFAVIGAEYILHLLPRGTHDYEKFIKPSELIGWCREEGLNIKTLKGMTYNPITQIYKLGKDSSVNYLVEVSKDH